MLKSSKINSCNDVADYKVRAQVILKKNKESNDDVSDIYKEKILIDQKKIILVSLFCGAGGLDLGFEQAGFKTGVAFDYNKSAVDSFNNNHAEQPACVVDIEKLSALDIVSLIKCKINLGSDIGIIGGPPCQGFSGANANSRADDPRNLLPKKYLEIVKVLMGLYQVHFLLIENVSGIKAEKHSGTFDGIIAEIERLSFVAHHEILNAVDFEVPQNRKRMIIVGLRQTSSKNFTFPAKTKTKIKRNVKDVISGFPEPVYFRRKKDLQASVFHPNHWTMMPKSDKFRADYIAPANSRSFKKVDWDLPSKTIAFGNREILVHPSGLRRLSIYEAMRLQGFPSEFILLGNLSSQVTQVSNAVPPPLAKAIALSIKSAVISNLRPT